MNFAKKMVLVPENTLERLQQREKIKTAPLTSRLSKLDHDMEDVLNSTELSNEEKARRYSQTLQNYLTYYHQRKEEPLKIKFDSTKLSNVEKEPQEGKESLSVPEVPRSVEQDKVEREIINSLPKPLKNRGKMLLEKIRENPDIMKWDSRGQLVFEDRPLPGSHIVDLVGDFMRERKGVDPMGWQVFARGLARMNAPEDYVRNERRREALREFKSRIRHQEDPSVWLPTPPPTDSPRRSGVQPTHRELPLQPSSDKTPGTFRSERSLRPRWLNLKT